LLLLWQRGGDSAHAKEVDALARGQENRRRLRRSGPPSGSRRIARAYPVVFHHTCNRNLPRRRGLPPRMDHHSTGAAHPTSSNVAAAGYELAVETGQAQGLPRLYRTSSLCSNLLAWNACAATTPASSTKFGGT